jgi:hypothetical protein
MSESSLRPADKEEVSFSSVLLKTFHELTIENDGATLSSQTLVSALSKTLGTSGMLVRGMLAACELMAEYAMAPEDVYEDSIEEEAEAIAASRRAFRPLLQARLQQRIDRIDAENVARTMCPLCENTMSSKGRPARKWASSLGELFLSRRWSLCEQEEHSEGRSLAQEKLLLPNGARTARLDESISMMATATSSHGMAERLLQRVLGVDVSTHTVQNVVHERAGRLMPLDDAEAEAQNPFHPSGLERKVARSTQAVKQTPEIVYVEIDGVLPMTRELIPERSEFFPGARGGKGRRYKLEGREVKNAVLYEADAAVQESDSRGSILDKRYVSVLGHWHGFARHLWVAMRHLRFDEASQIVWLSDGAKWIRELAAWLPCSDRVTLVLDLYHAKHRVWELANALYGAHSTLASRWAHEQCCEIEDGDINNVIARLRSMGPASDAAGEKLEELITYFSNNADRMNYPEYRAQGLRITSGGVESANYHVTGQRLKLQGMRWSERGAAEMARLRADFFNDTWEQRTRLALAA